MRTLLKFEMEEIESHIQVHYDPNYVKYSKTQ